MLALVFDSDTGFYDLEFRDLQLLEDGGINTAVVISLFTNRRDPSRPVGDQGGWSGSEFDDDDGITEYGSLLWTLSREPPTETTRNRAQKYCEDALQWLVDDGIAESVDVTVTWTMRAGVAYLAARVELTRPDDLAPRLVGVWEVYSAA